MLGLGKYGTLIISFLWMTLLVTLINQPVSPCQGCQYLNWELYLIVLISVCCMMFIIITTIMMNDSIFFPSMADEALQTSQLSMKM
jgi:hypothetical protein